MKFKIYQIKDIKNCEYAFFGYDLASRYGFNLNDYQLIYEEETDKNLTLDQIFRLFNVVTEEDVKRLDAVNYKGHSLSVSDIVEIDGKKYYCDSCGWEEI